MEEFKNKYLLIIKLEFRSKYYFFAKLMNLGTTDCVCRQFGRDSDADLTIIDRPPRISSAHASLLVFLVSAAELFVVMATFVFQRAILLTTARV